MTALERRVLLVDDAAEVRLLLQVLLELEGFAVSEALDGPTGLAAAIDQQPDVVLLDVQLPGLSGPDVLRALRSRADTAELPVVFLTAGPVEDDGVLLGLGATGVLHKPFDPDTVAREVRALL